MTKEGAEKVREAVKMIYEQCKASNSCANCPVFDCCDDLVACIPDTISGSGLNEQQEAKQND